MSIRKDFESFPFFEKTKAVWYVMIDWKNKSEVVYKTVQQKRDLIHDLKQIIKLGSVEDFKLLGVWNGQYSTDLFDIPMLEGQERLEKELI